MRPQDFWRGRKVFLTGHTGFKGAWLCKILEEAGADVTGYALEPNTKPNLYALCAPKVRSVIGDVRNFDTLFSAYQKAAPEIVIHMAAQPLVLLGYREPRRTYETNVTGTVNLLECVRLAGAQSVLNVTTDKVYLNRERPEGYREDETLDGQDPYSNSKSCSELVTAGYNRSFFSAMKAAVSTARSGNVIGGGDFAENRLIPDCARSAAEGDPIKLRNPGSIRPYQHVLDTLFAYLLIIKRQAEDASFAGSYNIGPDESDCVTSGRLADLFCEAWGDASWEHKPAENPPESGVLKLDCSKIKQALGWTPRWNIEQSVKAAVEWYYAFYNGNANTVMLRQIKEFLEGWQ